MVELTQLLAVRQVPLLGALTAAVCLSLYRQLRPFLKDIQHPPEEHTITHSKARAETEERRLLSKPPYPADVFPGGRPFKTVYGTIQVFEWGPEDGEKVLLVHGLNTPCISLGDMAKEFVRRGCRVMLYDLFGRGYSDAPNDLAFDARLYTTQILLVLSSSPLAWTGACGFHMVGFSLGGSIAAAFAAYHANMLRSVTLVCPGGLIRTSRMSERSRFLYSSGMIPEWLRLRLIQSSLESRNGASTAGFSNEDQHADVNFHEVPVAADQPRVRIGDVILWQLKWNAGFIPSHVSTVRSGLVYRRHDRVWRVLGDELARRRTNDPPPGLPGGRICLILAERDVIVVKDEMIEDSKAILCREAVDMHVMKGGHEVGVSRGKDVASIAIESWTRQQEV